MRVYSLLFIMIVCLAKLSAQHDISLKTLQPNMTIFYHDKLSHVSNVQAILKEGKVDGRLRFNSFLNNNGKEHYAIGTGGSFIYRSALLQGLGVGIGMYTTQNPWHMEDSDAIYYKGGKGVLSRYDVLTKGEYGISCVAQSYIAYHDKQLALKMGRFIYEGFLHKSNDTKMIPNTFQGMMFRYTMTPKTKIQGAYFTKQKLRDHSNWHHLLAYGDDNEDPYSAYTQNDDPAMHRGLTLSKLQDAGIKDRVFSFDVESRELENFSIHLHHTHVFKLLHTSMLESAYEVLVDGMRLKPAFRVMKQFDEGAGDLAGANIKNNTFAYIDSESLDATLYGLKLDLAKDAWKLRLGYTEVTDEADFVAPWRGFPTAGFSRAMAQYNWQANTKTAMLRVDYDFGKAGVVPDLKAFIRFVSQDFDDNKPGVMADNHLVTLDILKAFSYFPNLYMKTRMAYLDGESAIIAADSSQKKDPSYQEFRFELNYLF